METGSSMLYAYFSARGPSRSRSSQSTTIRSLAWRLNRVSRVASQKTAESWPVVNCSSFVLEITRAASVAFRRRESRRQAALDRNRLTHGNLLSRRDTSAPPPSRQTFIKNSAHGRSVHSMLFIRVPLCASLHFQNLTAADTIAS